MPKRVISLVLFLALLLVLSPVTGLAAQNSTFENPDDPDWTNHEQLGEKLREIEESSSGRVEVDVLGYSRENREVYMARVGSGDQVLLITGQIHGNEASGPEALLQMLETLATSDDPQVQAVRENVTIVAIPKFNPDGAELVRRQNVFPWDEVVETFPHLEGADPAWYYNASRGGFDINRDFNPDLSYEPVAEDLPGLGDQPGFYLTNESRMLRDLYLDLADEFGEVEAYVDLHHMGTPKVEGTDVDVTVALDYPPLGPDNNPKYAKDWPKWDQDKSRRYALAAAIGINEVAEDGVDEGLVRYTHAKTRDLPGQARSSFALNGTGTVLFEMPGQQPQYGYDQELIDRVEAGLWGIANHMADGSVHELDGDDFYKLPKYWADTPHPSEPTQYSTDFSEYELGQAPADWTPIWQGEDNDWTVLDEPRRLQHIADSGRRALTSDAVGEIYGDAEVFGLVRGSEVHETLFQIGFHMSGSPSSENAIYVDARMPDASSGANSLRIMQWRGGASNTLGTTTLPFTVEEDTWYRVLLQRSGEGLRAKMWPDGEQEPHNWQVVVSNTNMYGGKVGVSHFSPGTVNEYAFIGVGVGGLRAPQAPEDILDPSEPIKVADMIKAIDDFDQAGEFANDGVTRSLRVHLTVVEQFESQDTAEKVVKHMEGFKQLLDRHMENEFISESAYESLKADADALIENWE